MPAAMTSIGGEWRTEANDCLQSMAYACNNYQDCLYGTGTRKRPASPSSTDSRSTKRSRQCRQYRGSSGTRGYYRTRDRELRLQHFYAHQTGYRSSDECISRDVSGRCFNLEKNFSRQGSCESWQKYKECCDGRRALSGSGESHAHSSDLSKASNELAVKNDADGHLLYRVGDQLRNRYEILGLLGEGTFGKCLECYDRKRDRIVALKVIRNVDKYREAAKLEIKVLEKISRKDVYRSSLCIDWYGCFEYHGHACLVFPRLGKSVFDFMKENDFQPYLPLQVQHIAFQLIKAVKFLHDNKVTHTDLKPENMLFVDSSYDTYWSDNSKQKIRELRCSEVRLIDFGSATFDDEHHSTVVSTRHYRAPEVVLELGWSHPCDIWSCACIIYELYAGCTLFQTHDNREHLAMMERTLGPIPSRMIKATKRTKYFHKGCLDWNSQSSEGKYVRDNCRPLDEHRKGGTWLHKELFHLLTEMLRYEPDERLTAREALQHPFFADFVEARSDRHGGIGAPS